MLFKNYGPEVKKGRKLIHAGLCSRDLQANHANHVKEAQLFAKCLLDDPSSFRTHIRRWETRQSPNTKLAQSNICRTLTASLLRFTYGHRIESDDDVLISLAEEVMNITGKLVSPNRYAVDTLPIRKFTICLLLGMTQLMYITYSQLVTCWIPGHRFQTSRRSK